MRRSISLLLLFCSLSYAGSYDAKTFTAKDRIGNVAYTIGDVDGKAKTFQAKVAFDVFNAEDRITLEMVGVGGQPTIKGTDVSLTVPDTVMQRVKSPRTMTWRKASEKELKWLFTFVRKPASNVITMQLGGNWRDFIYCEQEPWLEPYETFEQYGQPWIRKKNVDGCLEAIRPMAGQGAIVVFHRQKRHHAVGGTNYGAGSPLTILAPKLTDAAGKTCWGRPHVDPQTGIYTETFPQEFWDKAIYPVVSNATFGPSFSGTSWGSFNANQARACGPVMGAAGTGTSITFHLNYTSANTPCTMCLYPDSSGTPNTNIADSGKGVTNEGTVTNVITKDPFTLNFTSAPTLTAQNYWISIAHGTSSGQFHYNYATGTAYDAYYDGWTYVGGSHPNPFAGSRLGGYAYNCYVTYTAGGAPSAVPQVIVVGEDE